MSSPNQLSFLPDDYLERKAQRRTNVICASLFLVVMVSICGAFTVSEKKTREVDKQHEAKRIQVTTAARKIQQAEQMEQKQRQMFRQAELAASLLEKVPRSYLLAEFTNALPPGVSLMDFNMEARVRVNKAAAAAAAPAGATQFQQKAAADAAKKAGAPQGGEVKQYDVVFKLTGLAYTDVQVAQYIRKLNESKLLKDVNLLISDQYQDKTEVVRKFQIECALDPQAEVPAAVPTTGKFVETGATEVTEK